MTAIALAARFTVDTIILAGFLFIALVVYTMYTSDTEMLNTIYCQLNTDSDLGFNACMVMHN